MAYVPKPYIPGGQDDSSASAYAATLGPAPYVPSAASNLPVAQAVPLNTSPRPSASTAPSTTGGHYITGASVPSAQYPSAYSATASSAYSTVPSPQPPPSYSSTASSAYPGVSKAPATYASPSSTKYSQYPSSTSAQTYPPASAPLPDFSQALDLPPPNVPSTPPPSSSASKPDYYSYSKPATTSNGYNNNISKPTNSYYNGYGKPDYPNGGNSSSTNNGLVISEGNPTQCHKVDYKIVGSEMQFVEVELDPDETVIAEAGAMMFLEEDVSFKAKLGDGSNPSQGFFKSLFSGIGRIITGESLFLTHFTNKSTYEKRRVAFAAPYPGNIIPVNMQAIGGKLICQKDAFICAAYGTKVSIHFNKRLGSGLFGGEGFILQKLKGDGMAFIHAGGTIVKKELNGERLRLDTGCLVAFTDGIDFSVELVPGLKSILFGGEGLFLATLQGTGTVWLQSLPFSRLADRILANAPSAGGRRTGEGNNLTGGLGDLIDGDGFQGWG